MTIGGPRYIEITLQGEAVAKWLARLKPITMTSQPFPDGAPFFATYVNKPIYVDVSEEGKSGEIPYLGEDSYINLRMIRNKHFPIRNDSSAAEGIELALKTLREFNVPIDEVELLEVRVNYQ